MVGCYQQGSQMVRRKPIVYWYWRIGLHSKFSNIWQHSDMEEWLWKHGHIVQRQGGQCVSKERACFNWRQQMRLSPSSAFTSWTHIHFWGLTVFVSLLRNPLNWNDCFIKDKDDNQIHLFNTNVCFWYTHQQWLGYFWSRNS